jgi:hypothetical protein
LSLSGTGGIYRLAAEAASSNPRLREPLFLYALFSGNEKQLLAATKSSDLWKDYSDLLLRFDLQGMEVALQNDTPSLPDGFSKVYRSYLYAKNKKQGENHTKSLMRNRILRLQREKNVSTYRLYTDLQINHGNMNAYIKHGDCSKVSLDTARRAVEYLMAYPAAYITPLPPHYAS